MQEITKEDAMQVFKETVTELLLEGKIKVTGLFETTQKLDAHITPYNAYKLGLLRRSVKTVKNAIKSELLTENVHYITTVGKKYKYLLITSQLNEINRIITH